MKRIIAIVFLVFLVGCATTVTVGDKYVLNDITCQSAEVTMSLSSKQLPTLCKDKDGNWQLVATAGRPGGQVLSEVIRGALLGVAIGSAVQAIGDIDTGTELSFGFGD